MAFINEVTKVEQLLNGRTIYFDFSSYDDENCIPHLFLNGVRHNVHQVSILDGIFYLITSEVKNITEVNRQFDVNEISSKDIINYNFDGLIRDIYYELPDSAEIGDYELDFLNEEYF